MAVTIGRLHKLCGFFFVISCLLIMRLFYLQMIEGQKLAIEGLSGRVQEVPMEVSRGEVLDRNGTPLTDTGQQFNIVVFPEQIKNAESANDWLSSIAGTSAVKLAEQMKKNAAPFKLPVNIDEETARKINVSHIPGIIVVGEKMRYGYRSLASHLIGYINKSDNRGVSGIEMMCDSFLRGSQAEYVAALVDASQQVIPGLGYKRVHPEEHAGPNNVILTIDNTVQQKVEEVMNAQMVKGAVVVMRPSTGEVIAMASRPNFDANNLGPYLTQESSPLLNRAVSAYQPGSVFKLVAAAAALESGIVHVNDHFFDPGYVDVNGLRFKGWDYEQGGHGDITFTEALAYSSNPVFIQVGLKLGPEKLVSYAQKFGFGHQTKLHFEGEADGNLPSADSLYPGDLANLTIGQGALEATPLQVASMVATIANDGIKVDPYIISKITAPDGTVIKTFPVSRGSRIISRQTAADLKKMMVAVTHIGTGQAADVEGIGAAGKTGSAETGRIDASGNSISHAWFAGYAPLTDPQYVVVVFVEEGMSGGDVAAPIFHDVISAILPH